MILSIETSGKICSVAIGNSDGLLFEFTAYKNNSHDKLLAEYVRVLLESCNIEASELRAVAVNSGPGSFTGLRIGAAIAKGLCFGGSPNLIAVPALSALAFSAIDAAKAMNCNKVMAGIPSHKDLVYTQCFDIEMNELTEILVSTRQEAFGALDSACLYVGGALPESSDAKSVEQLNIITATTISKLANKMYSENKFSDAEEYNPMYIQEFEPQTSKKQ